MSAKEGLKAHVLSLCHLDEAEWEILYTCFEYKELSTGTYLLQQDRHCDFVAYVQSGVFVYFRSLDSGDHFTTDFAFAGDWAGDMYSRLNNSPSFLNIKALTNSAVYILNQQKMESLYLNFPKMERIGRLLIEKAFVRIVRQTLDLQITDAKDRYIKLIAESPEILQKVPLYHIANYLGIAPKSLSRIRSEITRK
ncbi:Crp/Fnr family transcriptional regulator [Pedobacter sp. AW31-3R]|uniref:Crp/Fnr family transcriptional regulator n=1 Tax=Pedobacter sp. AW31-3R TaxID=3445781 RepID=UPI003F9F2BAD